MNIKQHLTDPGILRTGSKQRRVYQYKNTKRRVSASTLARIESIRIPPQWTNVWIASSARSHIQATGYDAAGRKQYLYSEKWKQSKSHEKYIRMRTVLQYMPTFKAKLRQFLREKELTKNKVIAAMFELMLKTGIRAGNEIYATEHGTYGLATLKQKHISGKTLQFTGKSGVEHTITLNQLSRPARRVLVQLQRGKKNDDLFPYTAADMNKFLKVHTDGRFTCKDLRTVLCNGQFITSFMRRARKVKGEVSAPDVKKIVLEAIDDSAARLGNTRAVCRSSYINPELIDFCLHDFTRARGATKTHLWRLATS